VTDVAGRPGTVTLRTSLPWAAAAVLFGILFWEPLASLPAHWWTEPDAGHGILLAPVAILLAWRRGWDPNPRPQAALGLIVLALGVALRCAGAMAIELFSMRLGAAVAAGGIVIFLGGIRQLRRWWLPAALLLLSIPLPTVVLTSLSLPLQLTASRWGAALLEWRDVPVRLAGNVIMLPGQALFVTEACSGLRSLEALTATALLIGGLWLRSPSVRGMLLLLSLPIAMVANAVRIFLTGFLVYFVDPSLGEGLMHYTEGWVVFSGGLVVLGLAAAALHLAERRLRLAPVATA
jgi:exosortase